MRRPEKKLNDEVTKEALLNQARVGRMATINRKGYPVIKPVNFLYWEGKIYLHSSRKGEKVEDIKRESLVCFEVDQPVAYVVARGPACTANYYYRSIIAKGKANLVTDRQKKVEVLGRLMEKYQPEGGYEEMPEPASDRAIVIEISVHEITGKEILG